MEIGNVSKIQQPDEIKKQQHKVTNRSYKHVYNHFMRNNILTKNQSGFTRGDSAVN